MNMLRYKKFNESKRNRGSSKFDRNRINRDQNRMTPKIVDARGMEMEFSPRFKYIIEKISKMGNAISKDFLSILNSSNKYDRSYIDLTNKNDTASYLPNSARDIKEDERYKTNKRQHVKIYKLVKLIFGSKYTKTDVTKFVSLYKSIFEKGPENTIYDEDKKFINSIIEDTKTYKLKWEKRDSQYILSFDSIVKITPNKTLELSIYIPKNSISTSIFTVNMSIKNNPQKIWIKTLNYNKIIELIEFIKNFN